FQAEDGIRDYKVTGVQTCALPIFVREEDPLRRLVATAGKRGMAVRGWTNNMHSTILASQNPDCAVQNVFGDAYITTLCPANPDRSEERRVGKEYRSRGSQYRQIKK